MWKSDGTRSFRREIITIGGIQMGAIPMEDIPIDGNSHGR